jgi:hypothetical protein
MANSMSGNNSSGHPKKKRAAPRTVRASALFRDVEKVKKLRKGKTSLAVDKNAAVDAPVEEQQLVADHEWDALLHTFEPEGEELPSRRIIQEEEDLWQRLNTTRWLKESDPSAEA